MTTRIHTHRSGLRTRRRYALAVARIAVLLLAAVTAGVVAVTGAPHPTGGDDAVKRRPVKAKHGKGLRVLAANPRYFTDGSGKAVYLTGSHVWWSLVGGKTWKVGSCRNPVQPFSFRQYLDQLRHYGHNFIRLWTIELPRWEECGATVTVAPQPWLRTGPGRALDDGPKFDLRRPNPAYFRRLRQRVAMAAARRIYVSIMLFEGWGLQWHRDWRWRSHPFNAANNVNDVDGDADDDGSGTEIQTLAIPAVTRIQQAYVRRVVDVVNRFDNVLFEVANESGAYSTAWQHRMIEVVKARQRRKPKRHPVGMTFQHAGGSNTTLLRSPADWVSPAGREFVSDPPVVGGRKVVLSDTDHHCGGCGDHRFPWKSFTRGHNPIHMDAMDPDDERSHGIRSTMGQTRRYANRMDLARSRPQPELASTRYCLVVPGRQYLVYQPESGEFTVDLRGTAGRYSVEWFDVARDTTTSAPAVSGGEIVTLTPPYTGQAVAFLRRT
jgi:hypothetical protein